METPHETTKGEEQRNPAEKKKITKASYLKIGQLVFVMDHCKGTFDPTYIYDHRVSGILNDSTDMSASLKMEKRRNATSITSSQ